MQIANKIDHTILNPDATEDQVIKLCEEAKEYGFYSVCIHPSWVKLAAKHLKDSSVKVCTVVGFPLGATTSEVKAFETEEAIQNGADEIDMVMNIAKLKDGDDEYVKRDIQKVVEVAKGKVLVKVIIETCLLTKTEKKTACELVENAGADYVKTSTGFSTGGATLQDIELMHQTVSREIGVKASGGIRDYKTARSMIEAGASRIGASASVSIVSEEV